MNSLVVSEKEGIRVTSVELVDLINRFRKEEGNETEKRHSDLLASIKVETDALERVGIGQRNFSLTSYVDKQNKKRPCYSMNKAGALQLLNKESAVVRYKTAQHIEKLEKQVNKRGLPTTYKQALVELLAQVEENEKLNEKIEYQQPLVDLAENRIDKKGCFSITDATKSLGLKKGNITRWAKGEGYIHKVLAEVNKAGEGYFKVYSTDGKHNAIGITEAGLRLIKKYINEVRLS